MAPQHISLLGAVVMPSMLALVSSYAVRCAVPRQLTCGVVIRLPSTDDTPPSPSCVPTGVRAPS